MEPASFSLSVAAACALVTHLLSPAQCNTFRRSALERQLNEQAPSVQPLLLHQPLTLSSLVTGSLTAPGEMAPLVGLMERTGQGQPLMQSSSLGQEWRDLPGSGRGPPLSGRAFRRAGSILFLTFSTEIHELVSDYRKVWLDKPLLKEAGEAFYRDHVGRDDIQEVDFVSFERKFHGRPRSDMIKQLHGLSREDRARIGRSNRHNAAFALAAVGVLCILECYMFPENVVMSEEIAFSCFACLSENVGFCMGIHAQLLSAAMISVATNSLRVKFSPAMVRGFEARHIRAISPSSFTASTIASMADRQLGLITGLQWANMHPELFLHIPARVYQFMSVCVLRLLVPLQIIHIPKRVRATFTGEQQSALGSLTPFRDVAPHELLHRSFFCEMECLDCHMGDSRRHFVSLAATICFRCLNFYSGMVHAQRIDDVAMAYFDVAGDEDVYIHPRIIFLMSSEKFYSCRDSFLTVERLAAHNFYKLVPEP